MNRIKKGFAEEVNRFLGKWTLSVGTMDAGAPFYVLILLVSSVLNGHYYISIILLRGAVRMKAKIKTFPQGARIGEFKSDTATKDIIDAAPPEEVVIPLQQHIGAPCKPLLGKGEHVKIGQKIGDSDSFVSAPVHASISGEVTAIEPRKTPLGQKVLSVVIESNGKHEIASELESFGDELPDSKQLIKIIREAGIVGMGGAAFPTHVKLSPPEGAKIDSVIINGCECEPYLTGDHRLMLENPGDILHGLRAIMKALGVRNGYIGIEDNKPDAINSMEKAASGNEDIKVIPLESKYPQGAEKMLIKAILNRKVPSGKLPLDVGVVVNNIGTTKAIADAVSKGMTLIERIVTISGSNIKNTGNYRVRLGTSFLHLINESGGLKEESGKVIMGGPMMGKTQHNLDIPVMKGTSGIVLLTEAEAAVPEPGPCIRCARCVDVCPLGLLPAVLANCSEREKLAEIEELHITDCIECGSCSYVCPAKRPLVHWIRLGKAKVAAERAKAQK